MTKEKQFEEELKMMEGFVNSYELIGSEEFSKKALEYFTEKSRTFIYTELYYRPESALSLFKEILYFPGINIYQKYYNYLNRKIEIKEDKITLCYDDKSKLEECTDEQAISYLSYLSCDVETLEYNTNQYKIIKELQYLRNKNDDIYEEYNHTFKKKYITSPVGEFDKVKNVDFLINKT